MLTAPPIDYDAIRAALVAILRQITGLGQNQVVMAEPEAPGSARPARPFLTLKFTSASISAGDDTALPLGDGTNRVNLGGQREMRLDLNCFGKSHEQACGIMATVQACFEQDPVIDQLDAQGIAVWNTGNVLDLSALLATGYEGRTQMELILGVASNMIVDYGAIESVDVAAAVELPVVIRELATTVERP